MFLAEIDAIQCQHICVCIGRGLIATRRLFYLSNRSGYSKQPLYMCPFSLLDTTSVHVLILSIGYVESTWCLNELLLMLDTNASIILVFYNVNPIELDQGGDTRVKPSVENLIDEVLVNENSKGEERILSLVNASLELSAQNSDESHSSDDAYNASCLSPSSNALVWDIPSLTKDDKRQTNVRRTKRKVIVRLHYLLALLCTKPEFSFSANNVDQINGA